MRGSKRGRLSFPIQTSSSFCFFVIRLCSRYGSGRRCHSLYSSPHIAARSSEAPSDREEGLDRDLLLELLLDLGDEAIAALVDSVLGVEEIPALLLPLLVESLQGLLRFELVG